MDGELSDKYAGNILPTRAIYPAKFLPYIGVLAAAKFFRSFGIFLSYDILKLIHVVPFLFLIKVGATLCFGLIQKPLSGRRISKRQWFRIGRHAFLGSVIEILWLYSLTLCGPLRTLLLFEHSDLVVIAAASALFTSAGSPSRFRGAIMFLLAFLGIMLFDHDLDKTHVHDPAVTHRHESVISHIFNHLTDLTGLSDHKAGVMLLLITLCLTVGYNMASKNLSLDIGGAKRLHALSTIISTVLLAPWALFIFYTTDNLVESWASMIFPIAIVTLLVLVADYYIDAACVNRLDVTRTSRFGTLSILASALALSYVWNHPFIGQITTTQSLKDVMTVDHEISVGVVFSVALFALATYVLMKPIRGSKGNFVGYSAAGPPLYNFAGEALHRTSQSVLVILKNGLRQILEEPDSRSIFFFLCVNLLYLFSLSCILVGYSAIILAKDYGRAGKNLPY